MAEQEEITEQLTALGQQRAWGPSCVPAIAEQEIVEQGNDSRATKGLESEFLT
jgi:hypothetical protein